MAASFQEGLGLQKKTSLKPQAMPYQGLNIQDFIGLNGAQEPTEQEKALLNLEQQKQKLVQEEAQWKSCVQSLQQTIEKLREDFEHSKAQLTNNLLELTFFLTQQLIDYEISTQPNTLAHAVQKLIDQSLVTEQRSLFLNPADHAFLKKKNAPFFELLAAEKIMVLEDPSLSQGHVKISSPSRQVESDVQKRLLEIKKQIPGNFLSTFIAPQKTTEGSDHVS